MVKHGCFRSIQKDVVISIFEGFYNIVVMAIGTGKSIVFQIIPLVTHSPNIVISPLISLMEDHVEFSHTLLSHPLLAGTSKTSVVKAEAWKHLYVYRMPELVLNSLSEIKAIDSEIKGGLSFIIVDEACCISERGHDFRSAFLRLRELQLSWRWPRPYHHRCSAKPEECWAVLLP